LVNPQADFFFACINYDAADMKLLQNFFFYGIFS